MPWQIFPQTSLGNLFFCGLHPALYIVHWLYSLAYLKRSLSLYGVSYDICVYNNTSLPPQPLFASICTRLNSYPTSKHFPVN